MFYSITTTDASISIDFAQLCDEERQNKGKAKKDAEADFHFRRDFIRVQGNSVVRLTYRIRKKNIPEKLKKYTSIFV